MSWNLEVQSGIRSGRNLLRESGEELKRVGLGVLVDYKLRSSYSEVWVFIWKEDGGVQGYS